jgi:hypothetical protein
MALIASPAAAAPRQIDSLEDFIMRTPPEGCRPTLFNYGERDIEAVTVDCQSQGHFDAAYALSARIRGRAVCAPQNGRHVCRIDRP